MLLVNYFLINSHLSSSSFWEVAIPVMIVVVPLFMWNDVIRLKHYVEKKTKLGQIRNNRAVRPCVDSAFSGISFCLTIRLDTCCNSHNGCVEYPSRAPGPNSDLGPNF